MALCIWTALHLNLPEHKKESHQVYRKILWLTIGLFAPEIVVWNAWRQRSRMKDISSVMRNAGFMAEEQKQWKGVQDRLERASAGIQEFFLFKAKDWPERAEPCRRQELRGNRMHPWTDVHSWYAIMGGFAFEDTSAEDFQFMPGNRQRMALTGIAVLWLTVHRPQLLPDISKQHIQNKSKSGGLEKLVTCWQTSYFCAQCVFRLSRQYSISLLELNVFAHAICALLLLCIWWDKPQDIRDPTLITHQDGLDLCAYFSLKPKVSPRGFIPVVWREFKGDYSPPLGEMSKWVPCQPCSDAWEVFTPTCFMVRKSRDCEVQAVPGDPDLLYHRYLIGPFRQPCLKIHGSFWTIDDFVGSRDTEECRLDTRNFRRLSRSYELAKGDKDFIKCGFVVGRCPDLDWDRVLLLSSVTFTPFSHFFSSYPKEFFRAAAGLTLAGGYYGGLHLFAWTCQFPSYVETMLWRAAGITILATGPVVMVLVVYRRVAAKIVDSIRQWLIANPPDASQEALEHLSSFASLAADTPLALWGLWYIFCRAFIVVECFIMLAHLPDTTLDIPQWATYIPHIT
jgi:hypothetical protein